ncbi:MAG TPA: hypothetical protein VJ180_12890 [Pyrinomonadaceae bacterium]|nr:hypothetical protein [Pyrinomonadaceae bacterium]
MVPLNLIPPLRTAQAGGNLLVYKHVTPNGVKTFFSELSKQDYVKVEAPWLKPMVYLFFYKILWGAA